MTDTDESPYTLPGAEDGPETHAAACYAMEEHAHIQENEIDVCWLFRNFPKVKGGRRVLGSVHEPQVQGELKPLFCWMLEKLFGRLPRFLVILDREFWDAASDQQREILVFHELSHIRHLENANGPRFDKDGLPVYGPVAHDVEEFISVAARYGAYNPDLEALVDAAQSGGI